MSTYMILLYARVVRHSQRNSIPQTAIFALGYLLVWLGFSLFAVVLQWLMALLFVGVAMNLLWIAGLSLIVLAEKLYPTANTVVYVSALILMVSGIVLLVSF